MNLIRVDAKERFLSKLKASAIRKRNARLSAKNSFASLKKNPRKSVMSITSFRALSTRTSLNRAAPAPVPLSRATITSAACRKTWTLTSSNHCVRSLRMKSVPLGKNSAFQVNLFGVSPSRDRSCHPRLGEVTEEKLAIVREADAIFREEIAKAGLDRSIWQYFACLPNIRSVGVMGDFRTYTNTIALRAVNSTDGMTSDWSHIPTMSLISSPAASSMKCLASTVSSMTSRANRLQRLSGNERNKKRKHPASLWRLAGCFLWFFVKCWGAPQLNRLLGTRQGICRVPFLPIHIENPVPKSVEITHSKCNSLNRLNQVVTAFCESIGVWLDNCLNNCSLPIFKRS